MVIIRRWVDERRWERVGSWRLVYGRRKTGKSFFVREFTEWGRYFFVLPNGVLRDIESNEELRYNEFRRILPFLLEEGIVIDEFHRLSPDFPHELHMMGRKGELTLITSSKFYARSILQDGSPLLGLVTPFPMELIDPRDILLQINDLEMAVFLREPWLIGQIGAVEDVIYQLEIVPALLGEIFKEEDRRLTDVYEAILLAVSSGATITNKIKSFLSGKLKPTVSISSFLKILEEIGLLTRIRVWGGGRIHYLYRHVSPVTDLYYYFLRYGFPEVPISEDFLRRKLAERLPLYVEDFVRKTFSLLFGYPEGVYIHKEKDKIVEVDIVLGTKRPKVVAEVKWKDRITKSEVKKVEERLGRFRGTRKILFVKDESAVPETELEVWDVERIVKEVEKRGKF